LVEKTKGDERYIGTEIGCCWQTPAAVFCGACAKSAQRGDYGQGGVDQREKIKKTALLPCRYTCPAEIDVPGYLRFISEGNYAPPQQ